MTGTSAAEIPLSGRLLLVDDDVSLREFLSALLRCRGLDVTVAAHGKDAVRSLERMPIDAVVIDLFMPEMEGIETIIQLRRRWPGLPIIAISGGAVVNSHQILPVARAVGAGWTLAKPFTESHLLQTVAEALRSGSHSRTTPP